MRFLPLRWRLLAALVMPLMLAACGPREQPLRIATHPWIGYEPLCLAQELGALPPGVALEVGRNRLRQVLSFAPDLEVVGAHADPEALLSAVDTQAPDVVMTDIRMPPTHTDEGMQVAERLRITHPAVDVVVLSQHGNVATALP